MKGKRLQILKERLKRILKNRYALAVFVLGVLGVLLTLTLIISAAVVCEKFTFKCFSTTARRLLTFQKLKDASTSTEEGGGGEPNSPTLAATASAVRGEAVKNESEESVSFYDFTDDEKEKLVEKALVSLKMDPTGIILEEKTIPHQNFVVKEPYAYAQLNHVLVSLSNKLVILDMNVEGANQLVWSSDSDTTLAAAMDDVQQSKIDFPDDVEIFFIYRPDKKFVGYGRINDDSEIFLSKRDWLIASQSFLNDLGEENITRESKFLKFFEADLNNQTHPLAKFVQL